MLFQKRVQFVHQLLIQSLQIDRLNQLLQRCAIACGLLYPATVAPTTSRQRCHTETEPRMADDQPRVRVCLTRCPLPPAEPSVHSLPCRIHHDGAAAIKMYFRPESDADTPDQLRAEFRGIQLQGERVDLASLGLKGACASLSLGYCIGRGELTALWWLARFANPTAGFVLEDGGLTHAEDDGRVWEVDHHFDQIAWWYDRRSQRSRSPRWVGISAVLTVMSCTVGTCQATRLASSSTCRRRSSTGARSPPRWVVSIQTVHIVTPSPVELTEFLHRSTASASECRRLPYRFHKVRRGDSCRAD